MRWLALYARSRGIPASLLALVAGAAALWPLAGEPDSLLAAFAMTGGAVIAGTGFAGHDVALEKTAALRWQPRRAIHALAVAAVIGGLLLVLASTGNSLADNEVILRGCLGSAGLTALGATLFGGTYAWTLSFGWFAAMLVIPPTSDPARQALTWLMQPAETLPANVTALVLGVGGILAYAVFGARSR